MSAEVILAEFKEVIQLSPVSPGMREKKLAFVQSFMMVMGLSFENLIKGVHMVHTPKLSVEGRLKIWKSHRGGHGIVSLAKLVTRLSFEEENLLKRLEEYAVWAGRYPISANVSQYVRSLQPENLRSFSTADPPLWNALFARLSQNLQTELKKQDTINN